MARLSPAPPRAASTTSPLSFEHRSRDGNAVFVNVIAFAEAAVTALVVMSDGESVALAGELTPKVWMDKTGTARPALDMTAHAILTAYHVQRKRRTVAGHMGTLPFDDPLPPADLPAS